MFESLKILLLASAAALSANAQCGDYGCNEPPPAPATVQSTSRIASTLSVNVAGADYELITTACGETIDSRNYTFETGKRYIWRVTTNSRTQRVAAALEFYGETWIFRSGGLLLGASNTISKPINKASARKPNGKSLQAASRTLMTYNCTNRVFAVFSGGSMESDYMQREKLLVSACDKQRIMPGYLVMSGASDNTILIDFTLITRPLNSEDVPRFIITSWPVDLPPNTFLPTTTAPPTTTTTTTPRPTTTTTRTTTTTTTTRPTTTTTTTRPTTTTTRPPAATTARPAPSGNCGRVETTPFQSRILGGSATSTSRHPWLVQMRYRNATTGQFVYTCAATLIHKDYVVSALHCFFPGKARLADWQVVFGADSATTPISQAGVTVQRITAIQWYKLKPGMQTAANLANYNPITRGGNIVVLKLQRSVTNVVPLCLPSSDWSLSTTATCNIAGWGSTGGASVSAGLNSAPVDLIPRSTCNQPSWYNNRVLADYFCAGRDGIDACRGDGGVPIACLRSDGAFELAGIAAWGRSPCGQPRSPGVYTQVADYVDWINTIINPVSSSNSRVLRLPGGNDDDENEEFR